MNIARRVHALLKRVVRAGTADQFQLRQVCPRDACSFDTALERAVDAGLVERVSVGVGRWFYRLTGAGRAAADADDLPRLTDGVSLPPRVYEAAKTGEPHGRVPRQSFRRL